jgi:hypothetical protein
MDLKLGVSVKSRRDVTLHRDRVKSEYQVPQHSTYNPSHAANGSAGL